MPPVGISAHEINTLVGPMLIGTWLNVWLLGAMLMQMQTYFRNSKEDAHWIKGMVAFLFVCGVTNSVMDVIFTYNYGIRQFGNTIAIQTSTWVFDTDPVMTVLLSTTVQTFFGWRVKRLTGQNIVAGFIFVAAFVQFLCGLGTSIACGMVKEFVHFQRFQSIVIVWLVLAPVTDFLISGSLFWYLHTHRTGFAYTDDIIDRVSRLTLQTGAITAVWASVDLGIYLGFANNLHLILNIPLGLLYCNCLMSSLNARRQWSTSSSYPVEVEFQRRVNVGNPGTINITTKSETHRDHYELNVPAHAPRVPFNGTDPAVRPSLSPSKKRSNPAPMTDDGLSLQSASIEEDVSSQKASAANSSETNWK
ncbi:uncharacterized protein EI90DRAFT_1995185 [Cantharellus anzutake]|uniref:uncharacterized protein n=1 Tax=Cantharellus anzutake TaxID=1750568 RepID=UPI0019033540|nr:uncharacterized protein EI90DRAFT_1995185 [Cantharellus anzutake]KAF8326084.1 hypothetical protein EI90DRAFT_1995185 [Cantharellus anzutake]